MRRASALIKSNNPHLAGGEYKKYLRPRKKYKNTAKYEQVVLRLPPQHKSHATFLQPYNAFYSITWQTRLYLCTWQKNMTPIMKAFQCDLQLEASFSAAKKTSVAAPAAHTSCPSPPAAATLHGKTQGFTLRLPPQHTHIYIYIYIYYIYIPRNIHAAITMRFTA